MCVQSDTIKKSSAKGGVYGLDRNCLSVIYNDGQIGHFDSSDLPNLQIFVIFSLANRANHKADLIHDSFFRSVIRILRITDESDKYYEYTNQYSPD